MRGRGRGANAANFLDRDDYGGGSSGRQQAAPVVRGKWKHDLFDTVPQDEEGEEQQEGEEEMET
jgi:hypothetical protein